MRHLKKLVVAFLGSALFRYPVWAMLIDSGDIRGVKPWDQAYGLLCSWDCSIYAPLSKAYGPENSAFFPGFPLLIRGMNFLFPGLHAAFCAILVSNLFAILAGVLVLYLGDLLWSDSPHAGPKKFFFSYKSWLALLILSVFPSAHFWIRGFSEPVFAVFLLLIVLFIFRSQWLWASVFAGLCAIVRPQGVWIATIFGLFFLFNELKDRKRAASEKFLKIGIGAVFTLLPFFVFLFWLWSRRGDPFYFYKLQQGWGRHFSLLSGLWDNRPRTDSDVAFLYTSLAAAFFMLRRQSPHWKFLGVTTLALAELPLFVGGFMSYSRFMSTNIGLMFFSAEIVAERPALALGLVAWEITHLAINTYHAGFGMWSG
jgi:hypothetical protein